MLPVSHCIVLHDSGVKVFQQDLGITMFVIPREKPSWEGGKTEKIFSYVASASHRNFHDNLFNVEPH